MTLSSRTKSICLILMPWLLLATMRYAMTAPVGDTAMIHNAIAESILHGNKWGLHALVKLPDIPLIPTLALVATKLLALPLGLDAIALLTALSQATLLVLIFRAIPRHPSFSRYAMAGLAFLPATPFFRNLILVNDPNWFSALPLACLLLAMERYRQAPDLKPLIAMAIHLGILVFCGPTLMVGALAFLMVICITLDDRAPHGSRFILCLPFAYALLLWFPWSLNPQENFLLQVVSALTRAPQASFQLPFAWQPLLVAAVTSFILALKTTNNLTARCLLPLFALIPLMAMSSTAAHLAIAGTEATLVTAVAVLVINAFNQPEEQRMPQTAAIMALALLLVISFRHAQINYQHREIPAMILKEAYSKPQPPPRDLFDSRDAPEREQLVRLADQQWKGSRIILPGKRLFPKVYPDPYQKHFRPLEDFTPRAFKRLADSEQFHLLVPPNDGRFYGPKSHLAKIHAQGAPYLILIAQLEQGWQLWRALPPANASHGN